jgi:hypothetical protein
MPQIFGPPRLFLEAVARTIRLSRRGRTGVNPASAVRISLPTKTHATRALTGWRLRSDMTAENDLYAGATADTPADNAHALGLKPFRATQRLRWSRGGAGAVMGPPWRPVPRCERSRAPFACAFNCA